MPSEQAWSPTSWRTKVLHQMPTYPDAEKLAEVEDRLRSWPPLVFAGEILSLKGSLALAGEGKAFLLQGGDCAESFDSFRSNLIRDNLRILLQMAVILTFGWKKPIIKVGRMAGQFAKPRTSETETRDGVTLPSYRGDIINGHEFGEESRIPDPERMERAYVQATSTLNLLRALAHGGFADLHRVHSWILDFTKDAPDKRQYSDIAKRLEDILAFMAAIGVNSDNSPSIREIEFFTSHEALLLPYEQAFTRRDRTTSRLHGGYEGDWYDCSAHFLWIGDRTRQLDGAHVEFLRGVKNPIGVKCGPTTKTDELLKLIEILNPENEPGRLTLVCRLGAEKVRELLPPILRSVTRAGHNVVWACDPMHGNTVTSSNGYKTRRFSDIIAEVRDFLEVHKSEGTHAGGVHLELTGQDVQECLGGDQDIRAEHLADRYETLCDPRLNVNQALELAFQLCSI